MSDFKAKMHQIRFPLGLRPRPHWGSLQRSPDTLDVFKGPTSKGKGNGEGREREERRERKGRVEEGKGGEGCPPIGESGPGSGGGEGRGEGQGEELGLGRPDTSFLHFKPLHTR